MIFLLNSGFYVLLYLSSVKIVKKTVHYLIEKDRFKKDLIILSFSRKDVKENKISFNRIDKKEFRFNGDMYDIKKDLSDKDSLRFLCYLDEHENLIEKLFTKYSDKKREKNSDQTHKLNLIPFFSLYFQNTDEFDFYNQSSRIILRIHINYTNFYKEILTPPPQTVFC